MIRRYGPEPVDPATVDRMLEHAQRAPNAGFSQGWAFLVLETPEERDRFWATTTGDGAPDGWLTRMRRAPLLIVPLSDRAAYLDRYAEPDKGWTDRDEARWPVPYWHVDTGMAALLILQTAVDEGLGACFFGIPGKHVDGFRGAFGIPDGHTPIGAITVGHRTGSAGSRGSAARRERRTDVVHRGRW